MNNLKTYLTEAYAIDNKSILRILTQNKQINKADPKYSYYEKLANWANSSGKQQKLKNIDLNAIPLSDKGLIEKRKLATRFTTLGHVLLALKNLMDQEGNYTPSSELSKLIQQTTLSILVNLSGIKDSKTPPKEPEDVKDDENKEPKDDSRADSEELRKGIDWTAEKAIRLANAKEPPSVVLDKFYNEYYNIEYAGGTKDAAGDASIVAKLKSLDKILIPEFNALGYNPEVNPLAQFLKNLIKHKRDIFNKLNTNNYGAIHNSFIDNHITGNMLGKFDESSNKNILFCTDLYNYKGLDIVKYLSFQNTILAKAKKSEEYSTDPWQIAIKILIQQNQAEHTYNTYAEKVNALKTLKEVILPIKGEAKLRSISEISELYRYVFNETLETEETSEYGELDEIVGRAKRKHVVLSMIRLILDQDKFKKEYPKPAAAYEEWLKEIRYKRNNNNIDSCREILFDDFTLDASDMLEIIKKLIKVYNTSKKDKTKV